MKRSLLLATSLLLLPLTATSLESFPLSTDPVPDDSLDMIPLDVPTKDYASTADDLHFCKESNYCSHNGRCDVPSRTCICDRPWTGTQCDQGAMNTDVGHNKVLITKLNAKTMPRNDRADGNELFLAKAHHRLRQVVAELSLTSEPKEELVSEKYRLMRSLGLLYISPGSSAHELMLSLEPAKVASRHPSHRRLPSVMTMRWNNPMPNDNAIIDAVQTAFRGTLQDAVRQQKKHTKSSTHRSSVVAEQAESRTHFGVFDERGGGAAGDRDLEKITGANSTTTVASENPTDDNAPVRNVNSEGDWNADYDRADVVDVNHEMTDTLPGLDLMYNIPTKISTKARGPIETATDNTMNVPLEDAYDPKKFSDEVKEAVQMEKEHKLKEAMLNEKIAAEVNTEAVRFKDMTNTLK